MTKPLESQDRPPEPKEGQGGKPPRTLARILAAPPAPAPDERLSVASVFGGAADRLDDLAAADDAPDEGASEPPESIRKREPPAWCIDAAERLGHRPGGSVQREAAYAILSAFKASPEAARVKVLEEALREIADTFEIDWHEAQEIARLALAHESGKGEGE